MYLTKKSAIAILATVLVAFSAVFATMAYLVSEKAVENTFTMGEVEIKLEETETDEYGVPADVNGDGNPKTETGNKYTLVPGQTYTKDPVITVEAGSENAYVRMLVTINRSQAILDTAFCKAGETFLPQNFIEGWDETVWPCYAVTEDTTNKTVTYEFRYFKTVEGSDSAQTLPALFTSFTVPGEMTPADIEALGNTPEFKITVVGHAIQAMGFTSDTENNLTAEDVAWKAFDAQKTANT